MRRELIASGLVQPDHPLAPYTTYKLGGAARWFSQPDTTAELDALISLPVAKVVIGRGSNLVVADDGFDGLVIRLGPGFGYIQGSDASPARIDAGASASLPAVARWAANAGIAGLEWMVGVPGSVGGAVRMNAGCFGADTAGSLVHATVVRIDSGETTQRPASSFDFGYRHSNIGDEDLVASAVFEGEPGDPAEIFARMREITRWRREHQPGGTHNAGSVFKNPPERAAGKIIDDLGLKGLAVGDVSVSEKHANFFVAGPHARASDIFELVRTVSERVLQAEGVALEPELVFLGFSS